jgi:hypothetical protein
MKELSAAGLADLAGVTEPEVAQLVELGVLVPRDGTGPFRETDVPKVRLAAGCERAGLPMAGIAAAIQAGRLSFAFLEAAPFRRWAVRSGRTYRQVSQETGVPLDTLGAVLESMGFARMAPDEPIREDELAVVPLLQLGLSSGTFDLAWLTRLGRAHADGLRLLATAWTEAYQARFEGRRWSPGPTSGSPWSWPPSWAATSCRWPTPRCWASTAGNKSWRGPSISSSASRTSSRRPACWDGQSGSRRCRSST